MEESHSDVISCASAVPVFAADRRSVVWSSNIQTVEGRTLINASEGHMNWTIFNKVKANDHPTTDHEGPEGE